MKTYYKIRSWQVDHWEYYDRRYGNKWFAIICAEQSLFQYNMIFDVVEFVEEGQMIDVLSFYIDVLRIFIGMIVDIIESYKKKSKK